MLYRLSYQSESTSRKATSHGARDAGPTQNATGKRVRAATRDRTRDLQIFSLTLSQLSYSGERLTLRSDDIVACRSATRGKTKKGPWGN